MLYEVLRRHQCLDVLPEPVLAQLRTECLENRLRNQLLRTELTNLILGFAEEGISIVLLKGAATFADNLYGAAGGRAMLDLDLLIRAHEVDAARAFLSARGYEEVADEGRMPTGGPTDDRHAHINGYRKPGSPLRVELHYNIAYGQGGRILSAEQGWRTSVAAAVDGVTTLTLSPTCRLIHNTVHGLIPERDYIKGEIRLWHIAEFAWLAERYAGEIDWQVWLHAAEKEQATTPFLAWLLLAHELLAMPLPEVITIDFWSRLQSRRLKSATLLHYRERDRRFPWPDRLFLLLHRCYYYCHLPGWVWRNICYAEGWRNLPIRIRYFLSKMLSRRSWRKI